MIKNEYYQGYHDVFGYTGRNEIFRRRIRKGRMVRQDWLVFETDGDARRFFQRKCGSRSHPAESKGAGQCKPQKSILNGLTDWYTRATLIETCKGRKR